MKVENSSSILDQLKPPRQNLKSGREFALALDFVSSRGLVTHDSSAGSATLVERTASRPDSGSERRTSENTSNRTRANNNRTDTDTSDNNNNTVSAAHYENQTINIVADILGILPLALEELLDAKNLTLYDLLDGTALHDIVKYVFGAQTGADLLEVPGVEKVLQGLSNAMQSQSELLKQHGLLADVANDENNLLDTLLDQVTEGSLRGNSTSGERSLKVINELSNLTLEEALANAEIVSATEQQIIKPATTTLNSVEGVAQNITATTETNFKPIAAPGPLTHTSPSEIIDQIKAKIAVDARGMISELRMMLRPEHLGNVTLRISIENGIMKAQFIAENEKVKEAIEAQLSELRDALLEQGLDISELSVAVGGDQRNLMEEFLKEQEKSESRIQNLIKNAIEEEAILEEVEELDMEDSVVSYRV